MATALSLRFINALLYDRLSLLSKRQYDIGKVLQNVNSEHLCK